MRATRLRVATFALLLALGGAVLGQDNRPPAPAKEEAKLRFRYERASVRAYLAYLSREAGLTFLDEAGIDGDITAIADKPITPNEALDLLRAWLASKTPPKTAVRQGNVVRIMTVDDAKKRGWPVRTSADPEQIPENDEIVTQVMPLRHVRATDVRGELRGLISETGNLYIEPTTNSLVITDTSAAIHRLALVISALDRSSSTELQVKVYRLKNAQAEDLANVLKDLFPKGAGQQAPGQQGGRGGRGGRGGGQGGGGGGFQQMARMFLQGGGAPGQPGAAGTGAEQTEIQVSTDKRTNSVVVAASKEQIALLDGLIVEMDKAPAATTAEIRPFRLENADARDLAAILTDLFKNPTVAANGGRGGQGGQGGNVPPWVRQFMDQQANAEANPYAPEPKFTVDQRTNTLLVSAVASDMGVISELVKSLDKDQSLRQSVMVMPLHQADAANVAKVLSDLLQAQTQIAQQTPGQGGGQQGRVGTSTATTSWSGDLSGQAKVVADTDANAVVVTTLPKNFPRIRAIVQDLDRVRREVLLECLIAEVTLDDKGELGVQWSTNWIRDFASQKGGTSNAGVDFGLGALSDGFKYTSASQHVSTVIRALRTEGKLNVLSSPKILALENKAAEISVGQDVPYVTNSRITTNGDTVNTVQYRTVGIILQATPAINEDGGVRMKIHPEVSQIGPQSEAVTITANVKSPVFERNFADTTISVRDGETAIIGGMIRDDVNETTQKIPIAGDIPLIGRIFQNRVHEKKKTEIVVFITPHVIEDAETLRRRTRAASEEFTLAPSEIVNAEIERWTHGLDNDSAVAHYNRGTVYLEGARYDDAVHELELAVAGAPRDAASRFNLGLALARKGDLERAELTLRATIDLDPRDPEVRYNLGAVLWRRGEFGAAAGEFRTALDLDPRHEEARKWLQRAEAAAGRPAPPATPNGNNEAPQPPKGEKRVN